VLFDQSHEIPGPALEHEAERRHPATRFGLPAAIANFNQMLVPNRDSDFLQINRQLFSMKPAGRIEMKAGPRPFCGQSHFDRQRGGKLELGRRHHRAEAERRGRSGQTGQKQASCLLQREPVQAGAVSLEQPVAARRAAVAVNRHAGSAQCVDVAIDGPQRHLALVSQNLRCDTPAGLQGHQDRQKPARTHSDRLIQPDKR
jgi:hypothetical protein